MALGSMMVPESTPNADAAANQPAEQCLPAGLEDYCPTVAQKANDSLIWKYPQSPEPMAFQTDQDIWLSVPPNGVGSLFWGFGTGAGYKPPAGPIPGNPPIVHYNGCELTGEYAVHKSGIKIRYAPFPGYDFGYFQTITTADPLVSFEVDAYCSHFSKIVHRNNLNGAPAEVSIGKVGLLKGTLSPRTVTETFMGGHLVGITINGKLWTNIPGQIQHYKEVAMLAGHYSRGGINKPWTGEITVTDPSPAVGQESFAKSPVVIRSDITAEVAGQEKGKVLVDGKLQPETVNWTVDMLNYSAWPNRLTYK
jgi:hypothetical protein